jgi:uncharacterized protein (DUF1501 family)
LLVVFLRGAADSLNMVVPHGEDAYYRMRPSLAIPRPGDRRAAVASRAIDLDGFFGLHPALAPLRPAWEARHLAIVHACGAPDESRSHFQAMELMERGLTNLQGPLPGGSAATWPRLTPAALAAAAVAIGERVQRATCAASSRHPHSSRSPTTISAAIRTPPIVSRRRSPAFMPATIL